MNAQTIGEPVAYVSIDFRNYGENGTRVVAYVCWLSKYAPFELFNCSTVSLISKKFSVDTYSATVTTKSKLPFYIKEKAVTVIIESYSHLTPVKDILHIELIYCLVDISRVTKSWTACVKLEVFIKIPIAETG